jgi:hypothetical protein
MKFKNIITSYQWSDISNKTYSKDVIRSSELDLINLKKGQTYTCNYFNSPY